jgi:phage tail sheath protein FI
MPEYLAPGVYIEETSFRTKTIEGVSTSTAGFVGPTLYGPPEGEPELVTSFADFERIYGGLGQLNFAGSSEPMHNYLAHAVRAFFEEGGRRLYVSRTYRSRAAAGLSATATETADGRATVSVPGITSLASNAITLHARYPGSGGNIQVTFTALVSQNVLAGEPRDPNNPTGIKDPVLRGVSPYDVLWITDQTSPIASPPGSGTLYWAERYFDESARRWTWRFHSDTAGTLELNTLTPPPAAPADEVRVVTVRVEILYPPPFPRSEIWENLALHPVHPRSLSRVFAAELSNRQQALTVPLLFEATEPRIGPEIARTLFGQRRRDEERPRLLRLLGLPANDTTTDLSILATLRYPVLSDVDRRLPVLLGSGNDGVRPQASDYEGRGDDDPKRQSGLKTFEAIADISIVAAPGFSFDYSDPQDSDNADQIMRHLIAHCERMRYRIAVLDSADGQAISNVRRYRGQVDSTHAALYYPWVRILDPVTEVEIPLPPSGFIAGIYARNDVEKGVHKAPANEVVRQAIGLEVTLNKAQQDVLNPEGVNCIRFFEGRGFRVWGARTISSDPEWKYVNLRRYFAFLERSIERGTQWVVFENNGEELWARVRRTVEDFLFNEWKSGHLLGEKPQTAYFVRCDRSTMTQNDLDNGRLICLIGVAPLRPAEFVIFRIGQWTADSRT